MKLMDAAKQAIDNNDLDRLSEIFTAINQATEQHLKKNSFRLFKKRKFLYRLLNYAMKKDATYYIIQGLVRANYSASDPNPYDGLDSNGTFSAGEYISYWIYTTYPVKTMAGYFDVAYAKLGEVVRDIQAPNNVQYLSRIQRKLRESAAANPQRLAHFINQITTGAWTNPFNSEQWQLFRENIDKLPGDERLTRLINVNAYVKYSTIMSLAPVKAGSIDEMVNNTVNQIQAHALSFDKILMLINYLSMTTETISPELREKAQTLLTEMNCALDFQRQALCEIENELQYYEYSLKQKLECLLAAKMQQSLRLIDDGYNSSYIDNSWGFLRIPEVIILDPKVTMNYNLKALDNILNTLDDVEKIFEPVGLGRIEPYEYDYFDQALFMSLLTHKTELCRRVIERFKDKIESDDRKIKAPINPHFNNLTPLMLAIMMKEFDIAKLLIEAGIYIGKCDDFGITPLCVAARVGSKEIVDLLIEHGAIVDRADVGISRQTKNRNVLLPIYGENSNEFENPLLNFAAKNVVPTMGDFYKTPLLNAIANDDEELVRYLLDKRVNPNLVGWQNISPLRMAVERDNDNIVKLLLDNGAKINAEDIQWFAELSIAQQKRPSPSAAYVRLRGAFLTLFADQKNICSDDRLNQICINHLTASAAPKNNEGNKISHVLAIAQGEPNDSMIKKRFESAQAMIAISNTLKSPKLFEMRETTDKKLLAWIKLSWEAYPKHFTDFINTITTTTSLNIQNYILVDRWHRLVGLLEVIDQQDPTFFQKSEILTKARSFKHPQNVYNASASSYGSMFSVGDLLKKSISGIQTKHKLFTNSTVVDSNRSSNASSASATNKKENIDVYVLTTEMQTTVDEQVKEQVDILRRGKLTKEQLQTVSDFLYDTNPAATVAQHMQKEKKREEARQIFNNLNCSIEKMLVTPNHYFTALPNTLAAQAVVVDYIKLQLKTALSDLMLEVKAVNAVTTNNENNSNSNNKQNIVTVPVTVPVIAQKASASSSLLFPAVPSSSLPKSPVVNNNEDNAEVEMTYNGELIVKRK